MNLKWPFSLCHLLGHMHAPFKQHTQLILVAHDLYHLIVNSLRFVFLAQILRVVFYGVRSVPHVVQFHGTCAVHECQALVEFADLYCLVVLLVEIGMFYCVF